MLDINAMILKYNKEQIAINQLKIKYIHKDIIRLKQENRNIGDKVRNLLYHVCDNDFKLFICKKEQELTYKTRIKRDLTTIEYLQKLQEYNSKLINKHRSKIKVLKKELSVLKGAKE